MIQRRKKNEVERTDIIMQPFDHPNDGDRKQNNARSKIMEQNVRTTNFGLNKSLRTGSYNPVPKSTKTLPIEPFHENIWQGVDNKMRLNKHTILQHEVIVQFH